MDSKTVFRAEWQGFIKALYGFDKNLFEGSCIGLCVFDRAPHGLYGFCKSLLRVSCKGSYHMGFGLEAEAVGS